MTDSLGSTQGKDIRTLQNYYIKQEQIGEEFCFISLTILAIAYQQVLNIKTTVFLEKHYGHNLIWTIVRFELKIMDEIKGKFSLTTLMLKHYVAVTICLVWSQTQTKSIHKNWVSKHSLHSRYLKLQGNASFCHVKFYLLKV